jgi:hypothetical protein
MPEPDWKTELSADVECAIGFNVDCGGTVGVHRVRDAVLHAIDRHIDAAYLRGLNAGRSQSGYTTRRKKKEEPWPMAGAGAAGPTPASTTEGGEP